jgi:hypothetical protein
VVVCRHDFDLIRIFRRRGQQVVRNVSNAFEASFRDWTVGLGIEDQLNSLRELVGLARIQSFQHRTRHLDYAVLVKPQVGFVNFVGVVDTSPQLSSIRIQGLIACRGPTEAHPTIDK